MSRLFARTIVPVALVGVVAVASAACSDNTLSQLAASTPTTTLTLTDTVVGTLTQNGSFQHIFTISTLGTVTVTIVSLSPSSSQVVGLSLGVWTGTQCSTSPQTGGAANDTATTGSTITLNATAAGNLCARIYDVGYVNTPVQYTLQITHP